MSKNADRSRRGTSNDAEGDKFENYVQSLYQALGYRVVKDRLVRGKQTDLVAERTVHGRGVERLLIECKHTLASSIGIEYVEKFIYSVTQLCAVESISAGILVTNATFSRYAHERVKGNGQISLITTKQLEAGLLDPSDAYIEFTSSYRQSPIANEYIPLDVVVKDVDGSPTKTRDDAAKKIAEQLRVTKGSVVMVEADYGAGKTTLLKNIKYEMACRYLASESELRPILFLLKEFYTYPSLEEFIGATLRREFWSKLSIDSFWTHAAEGRFVFLLDGLDEMNVKGTPQSRVFELKNLAPLLLSGSSSVVTCRPTYFITSREMMEAFAAILKNAKPSGLAVQGPTELADLQSRLFEKYIEKTQASKGVLFLSLSLCKLDNIHINSYIRKREKELQNKIDATPDEVFEFLRSVYDLSDLVTRPLLLSMIIDTILLGKFDVKGDRERISASQLYDVYTSTCLDRDWQKGITRQELSTNQRRLLAIAIALAMFDNDRLEVTHVEIERVVSRVALLNSALLGKLPSSKDVIVGDVRVSTFLERTHAGSYKFTHKSFFDFFVALGLHQSLVAGKPDPRLKLPLERPFLYFIGGFLVKDKIFRDLYIKELERLSAVTESKVAESNETLRKNLANAILYSGNIVGPFELADIKFVSRDVQRLEMDKCQITRCSFAGTPWSSVKFTRSVLTKIKFIDCRLEAVALLNSSKIDAVFTSCVLENMRCEFSRIVAACEHVSISRWTCKDANLRVSGHFEVTLSSFEECLVQFTAEEGNAFVQKSTFSYCEFVSEGVAFPVVRGGRGNAADITEFIKCPAIAIVGRIEEMREVKFDGCSGFVAVVNWGGRDYKDCFYIEDGVMFFDVVQIYRSKSARNRVLSLLEKDYKQSVKLMSADTLVSIGRRYSRISV